MARCGSATCVLKVLYYESPGAGIGGSRRSLVNLIRGLGDGVQAFIVADLPAELSRQLPRTSVVLPSSRIWPPGADSAPGRLAKTVRWWYYALTTSARLAGLIWSKGIHVVHGNNSVTTNAPAVLAARLTGRPYVSHLRGTTRPTRETRWLFRHVRHFVAISESVRDYYARQGLLDGGAVSVIYNSMVLEEAGRRIQPEPPETRSFFRVGMFARMIEYKGHAFFLDVARKATQQPPSIQFAIHGPIPEPGDDNWPYYEHVCQRIQVYGLQGRVRLAGPYSDVAAVMGQTDVVLCCSPYDNFGRILFEAMACGVPVVAFDAGGVREAAVSGENCLLVPCDDTTAMADAVIRLATDPVLRQRLVQGGHRTAEQLFDHRANATRVLRIYEQLLGRG